MLLITGTLFKKFAKDASRRLV